MITPVEAVNAMKKYPPVKWEKWVNKMTTEQRQQYADVLEQLAIQAAWMTGYIEARHGSGCGNQGHNKAVRNSNVVRAKVRKAFGCYVIRYHPITF